MGCAEVRRYKCWQVCCKDRRGDRPVSSCLPSSLHPRLQDPPYSTSAYLDQHKVAIVCSARSGKTKALGTTNLLLRAASEALQRTSSSASPGTPGIATPTIPAATAGIAHSKGFWSRKESVSSVVSMTNGMSGVNGTASTQRSRADTPNPSSPRSPSSSPSPFSSFHTPAHNDCFSIQPFHATVDLLRQDHLSAARSTVRDPIILAELETEIIRDCERLREFLFAAQVTSELSIYQTLFSYLILDY